MKNANKFYTSPGKGGQGKASGRNKFLMCDGSKGQGKVGGKKNKFAKVSYTTPKTTGSK